MLYLLIDHYNIDFNKINITNLFNVWLNQLNTTKLINDVKVRVYGGWNIDGIESDGRFEVSAYYQKVCPSYLISNDKYYRITFEFAENLLLFKESSSIVEKNYKLQNTVVKRTTCQELIHLGNKCDKPDCELKKIKKWVKKKKACTSVNCENSFEDFFVRREQKQVDMHLGIDILTCNDKIIDCEGFCIVTNDQDILPALLAVTQVNNNIDITYLRTIDNDYYCDEFLIRKGIKLVKYRS